MDYKVTMPYLGGILTDNNYKIGRTKRNTRPIVVLWMNELAEKVQALCIPPADSYRIGIYGKFWDERRPDLANLHKVMGDALARGLAINDKAFLFSDLGYELGKFEMELEITITPLESLVKTFQAELSARVLSDDRLGRLGLKRKE